MGPPGGGRNPIDNRVLRHFHFLSFPDMENDTKVCKNKTTKYFLFHNLIHIFI